MTIRLRYSATRRPNRIVFARGTDGLDDVFTRLKHGVLAVDTETTGLNWRRDLVGSVQFAAGETAVFCYQDALGPAMRWLSDQVKRERTLVFHHAKFDMHMMRGTFGLNIPYPVHCTQVMSHLIDNRGVGSSMNPDHQLKSLAKVYVDPFARDAETDLMQAIKEAGGGSGKEAKANWLLAPWRKYALYSALDPWYTLQLYEQFIERIRHWPQPSERYPSLMSLYQNERWLINALRDMEATGICVDERFFRRWEADVSQNLNNAHRRLRRRAGRDINWNSNPQLAALLYGKRRDGGLNIQAERFSKKTKNPSTDKTALVKMSHPIGAELLMYRKMTKQHQFAEGLMERVDPSTNALHCHFNQNVSTGRMSCSDPNLQQQDRESGVRRGFIPRKGLQFRFADYSQIEMRFAAHMADEQTLIRGFNKDPDFDTHAATAAVMFGVRVPSKMQRDHGKTMNFATLYGAGEDKRTEDLMNKLTVDQAHQACRELGIRVKYSESPHRVLSQQIGIRYRKAMPKMKDTANARTEVAEGRGFAINLYGRHRYLDEDECYVAFNTEIQGTAADQAKRGLVAVYREQQLSRGSIALLLQIHDEIIYETDGDPRVDKRVIEALAETKRFKVPILADMKGSTKNWQDKTKVKI
jgi:DNA polymerase-1